MEERGFVFTAHESQNLFFNSSFQVLVIAAASSFFINKMDALNKMNSKLLVLMCYYFYDI